MEITDSEVRYTEVSQERVGTRCRRFPNWRREQNGECFYCKVIHAGGNHNDHYQLS